VRFVVGGFVVAPVCRSLRQTGWSVQPYLRTADRRAIIHFVSTFGEDSVEGGNDLN